MKEVRTRARSQRPARSTLQLGRFRRVLGSGARADSGTCGDESRRSVLPRRPTQVVTTVIQMGQDGGVLGSDMSVVG